MENSIYKAIRSQLLLPPLLVLTNGKRWLAWQSIIMRCHLAQCFYVVTFQWRSHTLHSVPQCLS